MRGLTLILRFAEAPRCSAAGRDAPQAAPDGEAVHNVAVLAPGGAAHCRHFAQRIGRAALDRDLPQLSVGEKPDPLAVRGEELVRRILRAGENGWFCLI